MKAILISILMLAVFSCSSLKQNGQDWQVKYLNSADSSIVQIKGLYTNRGKLLYNNEAKSNVNKRDFRNNYLFKLTAEQIIALEEFVMHYELANNSFYKNDTLKYLRKYKKYGRLYTGHVCTNGDSIFVLNLIERPGKIADYTYLAPPIMAEPWIKVLNRDLWYVDLKRKKNSDIGEYFSPCVPLEIHNTTP